MRLAILVVWMTFTVILLAEPQQQTSEERDLVWDYVMDSLQRSDDMGFDYAYFRFRNGGSCVVMLEGDCIPAGDLLGILSRAGFIVVMNSDRTEARVSWGDKK